MHRIAKIPISHLNEQIICGLCFGYLVDAATIVECLHSFCRSCLVQYLADSNACPLCCQLIHKTKPLVNIRSDKTLQNLVYKLVPGLFKGEMERRRNFYSQHPEAVPDVSSPNAREERGDIHEDPWLTQNNEPDLISISLQYSALFSETHHKVPKPNDKRYLLCPSYITVAVLKKFIRCKFDLPSHFHIELYYSDECLDDSYSVMDIASLYTWRRMEPLQLFYFFFDSSPSAISTLQQKSLLSAALSNSSSISDEKVVEDEQKEKKRKRKVEHSWCLKPIKTFRIRDLDKIETCAYDAILSSNLLSSTSATGICDEALHLDKGLCGTKSLTAASTSDANSINAKKAQSLERSADNDSGDNSSPGIDNKDNGSVDNGSVDNVAGLEETTVNRTLTVEGIYPLRLLRLSPKPKPQSTRFESEGVSNSRHLNEHHSGTISSSSRSVHDPSHRVRDATGSCRSSSCHQPKQSSSASTSSTKAPSSTEPRSIWSVLPSPRLRIQEGKSSATIGGPEGDSPGSVSSQRVSHAGYHRPSCHSRGSISIYEDPYPSKSTNLSMSTTVSTSTKLSTSTPISTSTILSTPTAKVGIVICRGRAMPLQDKHLHLAPTTPSPLPPPPPPPIPIPPIAHSCSLAVSSSSDARRPASVKRLLQIQAESENLTATKKRRLSDQDGLPLISTTPSLFLASYLRTLGAFAHTATAKQKVARVFRDRNALASLSPPSSKLSPAVGPLSPLPQAQSVCRPLKPRRQMMNVKPIDRTRSDRCNSISCVDESKAAAAAAKGLVLADDRRGIRGIEHPLELTTIK